MSQRRIKRRAETQRLDRDSYQVTEEVRYIQSRAARSPRFLATPRSESPTKFQECLGNSL